MSLGEEVADGRRLDRDLDDLAGLERDFSGEAIAVAAAKDGVGQVHGEALRPIGTGRIEVDELGGEIGVLRRR